MEKMVFKVLVFLYQKTSKGRIFWFFMVFLDIVAVYYSRMLSQLDVTLFCCSRFNVSVCYCMQKQIVCMG